MKYEMVIGIETHVQLNTASKIFCSCAVKFGSRPNSQVCPVCMGFPGVLPVLNQEVLQKAIKAGLATDCQIAAKSKFDRKQYFYPDLPKAYQISQYDLPIAENGKIKIYLEKNPENNSEKTIGITRIHMEEDAGKLIHSQDSESYADLNRCGVPLVEIVSEPDIRSAFEAVSYTKEIQSILRYIDVSDADMEKGQMRFDVNISLRPFGQQAFGTRAELKNLNSFSSMTNAIKYEFGRQSEILDNGQAVTQETRLWDDEKGVSRSMRSKEEADDYRYFPEPDLVEINLSSKEIDDLKAGLPELPQARLERFQKEIKLSEYNAGLLTQTRELADYFENTIAITENATKTANWIATEILGIVNEKQISIKDFPVKPDQLAELLLKIDSSEISGKIAKEVFAEMLDTHKSADSIITEKGLKQISDDSTLESIIDDIIANNPKETDAYRSGKTKLMGFFVGQVMKASKGKANPQKANKILLEKLK